MSVIRELRELLRLPGFRRLFVVRLSSQAGDGLFQVGLATLFFFNPEQQSTAGDVAIAFAVLLLPFTIVGPWAGVLLDLWRRRQVLLVGNLVRAAIAVVIAVLMVTTGVGPAVYVLALLALSVNRFLLSALSASLPRVVDGPLLLTANSLTPTLGAGAVGVGGGIGLGLGLLLPDGPASDAAAVVLACVVYTLAGCLALRIGRDELGPETVASSSRVLARVRQMSRDLADGARHLIARRTPAAALTVMATSRFLYGVTFIASILISRNLLADPRDAAAGLAVFSLVLTASAVGFVLAAVLTPVLSPRTGPHAWITLCMLLAAATQTVLAFTVSRVPLLLCAVALGLAAQGAKIAVDTIVQRDTADEFRGRAFALYDVLYNAAFVGAAGLAALTLNDTGWSRPVFAALAVGYLAAALGYRAVTARAVAARRADGLEPLPRAVRTPGAEGA
ncbi:MFS transporter [Cellulomonas chengniuliangii]|uniref:MFS transporter n=1 Tax=Cellulomonas chengniuliangii TaxID=2968084 RepID=A0ABY5L0X8_9CELL|nr:MFS transporter [Cellulomonas chengniuliangii]MCC2307910.1 MFS transporter [Cellulomonas chengniuliangii]UUI75341.1 MFS transporter [Cellulomonas chengniuliangii]